MRTLLIAELAVNHLGDLRIAEALVAAAADAGADYVKTQAYSIDKMRPTDPNYALYKRAALDRAGQEMILRMCERRGVRFLSTPFDEDQLAMLRGLEVRAFKIASSESGHDWWEPETGETWFVSYPWGRVSLEADLVLGVDYKLTAIPLYPTPLECVGQAALLDGWSDHSEGIDACLYAIANGAKVVEVHLTLGDGRGRQTAWDKTPAQLRQLRDFADACATMRTGVSTRFRERWTA